MCKRCLPNRLFCQQYLTKVLDRFFTVLTITSSFLVCFRPVKYRIESLITLFRMLREWSVRFSFRSGQQSGQTLVKHGQPWSNFVEFGQSPPNSGKCIPNHILRASGHGGPWSGWKWLGQFLGQPSVNFDQTWSTLGKLGRTLGNVPQTTF